MGSETQLSLMMEVSHSKLFIKYFCTKFISLDGFNRFRFSCPFEATLLKGFGQL